jgi:uncharacterized protein
MFGYGMGIGMDPLGLLLSLVGIPLIMLPQWWVKSTYNKFRQEPTARGMTGSQVASDMLRNAGIHDVVVEETPGELSDHYDPGAKAVRLSPDNYQGTSIAAATIAAHEVGHAMQHNQGYIPVSLRGALFPVMRFGSQLAPLVMMGGFMMLAMQGMGKMGLMVAALGVGLFGLSVIFHLVTLPVELDASARALRILQSSGYLQSQEMPGAKKVLTAAAFTYISVAMYSLMQMVYYVFQLLRYTSSSRSSDE